MTFGDDEHAVGKAIHDFGSVLGDLCDLAETGKLGRDDIGPLAIAYVRLGRLIKELQRKGT